MALSDKIYKGEDVPIIIKLSVPFADLVNLIIGFQIDNNLLIVKEKTETGLLQIEAVAGEPNQALVKLYASETIKWPCGKLLVLYKAITTDTEFPLDKSRMSEVFAATVVESKIANIT
jgi:hypothetical protein